MTMSDKQIRNRLKIQSEYAGKKEKIDMAVIKSRQAFYAGEEESSLSKAEFLYQQSQYIHKRWWVIQGLILLGLWFVMKYSSSDLYIRVRTWTLAPLFGVLIMPELWKNRHVHAMEIECAAYFSLRQIYAARLVLFALVDLVLLSVFCFATVYTTGVTVRELVIQFFLPCSVTCCICFHTLYNRIFHSEVFALLLCVVWSGVWFFITSHEFIYNVIYVPVWNVLFIISILYMGYCIYRGQRDCNRVWENEKMWYSE